MPTIARTPKGHRVSITVQPIGTKNEQGIIRFGDDGPKLSSWTAICGASNVLRTMEDALAAADERIEAMGLVDSEDEPRTERQMFRVTTEEKQRIKTKADEAGQTVGQYIRSKLL